MNQRLSRSCVLGAAAGLAGAAVGAGLGVQQACRAAGLNPMRSASAAPAERAQIAITLDLEMSRNFPQWETTHWDYEKGNLNDETKRYSVEAARRVRAASVNVNGSWGASADHDRG